jgi:uncharacterized protein YprB with RNaseH-like and TPR domain
VITSCAFDLETSDLSANFGVILCAVIQPDKGPKIVLRSDQLCPTWKTKRSDDSEIVRRIARELCQYDILIAHYGAGFDIPFLRTRLAHHDLPPFPNKKLIDPFQIARNKFRMKSNSLAALCDALGVETEKTPVLGQTWVKAFLDGDIQSMNYIVEHCVHDVAMLAELVGKLKAYSSVFNDRGSGW